MCWCVQALGERLAEREGLIKARRAAMVAGIADRQVQFRPPMHCG